MAALEPAPLGKNRTVLCGHCLYLSGCSCLGLLFKGSNGKGYVASVGLAQRGQDAQDQKIQLPQQQNRAQLGLKAILAQSASLPLARAVLKSLPPPQHLRTPSGDAPGRTLRTATAHRRRPCRWAGPSAAQRSRRSVGNTLRSATRLAHCRSVDWSQTATRILLTRETAHRNRDSGHSKDSKRNTECQSNENSREKRKSKRSRETLRRNMF